MRQTALLIPATLAAAIVAFAAGETNDKTPAKQTPAASKSPKTATAKSTTAKSATAKTTAPKAGASKTNVSKSNVSTTHTTGKNTAKTAPQTAKSYRRSGQVQPTPDRYKEIQQALSEKGYFGGSADGNWGPESVDALKRFQHDQNLTEDGKIGSLSLIALGLGPKREVNPAPIGSAVP